MVRRGIERREDELLATLRDGVYAQPTARTSRCSATPASSSATSRPPSASEGVEGTLAQLYDAGVRITLDELKGRVPITRPGLELEVGAAAFVNPLARGDIRTTTAASRGVSARSTIDLRRLERDAAHTRLFQHANGLEGRPIAAWRPSLPATPGINAALQHAKLGQRTERWFAQLPPYPPHESLRSAGLLGATLAVARAPRQPDPAPAARPARARRPRRPLSRRARRAGRRGRTSTRPRAAPCACARRRGRTASTSPAPCSASAASPTRRRAHACSRARDASACRCSRPTRPAASASPARRATTSTRSTCCATSSPSCAATSTRRTRRIEGALVLTTLWSGAPKLLLNVESDDTAVVEEGPCGCPLGDLGQTTRLHTVRSWEKLTTEGMTFTSSMLLRLVEEVLPARFGGGPTDWQLVEDRSGAISDVRIVVSPRVGPADADGHPPDGVRDARRGRAGPAPHGRLVARGGPPARRAPRALRDQPPEDPAAARHRRLRRAQVSAPGLVPAADAPFPEVAPARARRRAGPRRPSRRRPGPPGAPPPRHAGRLVARLRARSRWRARAPAATARRTSSSSRTSRSTRDSAGAPQARRLLLHHHRARPDDLRRHDARRPAGGRPR